MSTATARPDRQQFLKPYLERLVALDGHAQSPGSPTRINVGSRSLRIEPWERGVVVGSLKSGDNGESVWPGLLADAVALQVKSLSDLERLARTAETENGASEGLRTELELDAGFGFALMTEIQRAVDGLIVAGEMDLARKLTRFRNKLVHQLGELRGPLGREGVERAEYLAAELIAEARRAEKEEGEDEEDGPGEKTNAHALLSLETKLSTGQTEGGRAPGVVVTRRTVRRRRRPKTLPLLGVLAVSVAAWLLITVRPALTRVELPVFSVADFQSVPAVVEVRAKPPALYVTVDSDAWRSLSDERKTKAVQAIASRIATAEYTGANLTDSAGRTVARWLKHSGVKLIEPAPAGS